MIRSSKIPALLGLGSAVAVAAGCGAAPAGGPAVTNVAESAVPASAGSLAPNLFAGGDGRVYLSWLEAPDGERYALRLAVRESGAWSEARTVEDGADFWVNWADFPSVVALPDGRLAAHWLERSGPGTYDYDVHIVVSGDDGLTWSESVVPHRDGTLSEHGFVSLFPAPDGLLGAVWLDGRHYVDARESGEDPEMTLRATTLGPAGELGEEVVLDGRVCDCCQTSAAVTADGPVVVYRDRSPGEVRDISVVRLVDGRWTDPAPVHEDGWVIPACPVNGPMIAAAGRRAVVAWFTNAGDTSRVRVSFSDDAGARFGPPVRVDDGDPAGRVAVALLPDGAALVSWLESTRDGGEVRVRRVDPGGGVGPALTVAESSAARASGFPRMVVNGDEVVFAWTEPGEPMRVRAATARIGGR